MCVLSGLFVPWIVSEAVNLTVPLMASCAVGTVQTRPSKSAGRPRCSGRRDGIGALTVVVDGGGLNPHGHL